MKGFIRHFARNKAAVAGLAVLAGVVGFAVLAPVFYPQGPWAIVGRPLQGPFSGAFALGTDTLGRDVLAGLIHGARVSLLIGIASALAAILVGVVLGAAAGYFGGTVDDVVMRVTEAFQTIPNFVLTIVLVAMFKPSIASIIVAIAVVSWPPVARLVRGEFLTLRSREFVLASVAAGSTNLEIIVREILPNAISPVVVLGSLMVATAILLESSLSFLGLGDPNVISWGYMVGAARVVLRAAWWMAVFPGLAIVLTVLAINLVGEGLNDALNPRLVARGRT